MPSKILIIDDDGRIRTSLSEALESSSLLVRTAASGEAAIETLSAEPVDVVLADVRMPGLSGLDCLQIIRQQNPETAIILMTAYEDLPTVAAAMRDGAADFLVKPLDLFKLRDTLNRVLSDQKSARKLKGRKSVQATESESSPVASAQLLVGRDPAMINVFKLVGQAAATSSTVLIRGESGTGKELIARAIHALSDRAGRPFIPVNCAAIPDTLLESELFGHVRGSFTGAAGDRQGRFALGHDGTILLDEIGDTSPELQSKLLRVLQEGEYYPLGTDRPQKTNARVLAATHQDLEELVERQEFRRDLYYRLRVVEISVPPLRYRKGDIPLLVQHLIERKSQAFGRSIPVVSDECLVALRAHNWPGNVRELENCLERALVMAPGAVIRLEHLNLSPQERQSSQALLSLSEAERAHIERILRATGGNKSRAAGILGISRPRLDRLIQKFQLGRRPAAD